MHTWYPISVMELLMADVGAGGPLLRIVSHCPCGRLILDSFVNFFQKRNQNIHNSEISKHNFAQRALNYIK